MAKSWIGTSRQISTVQNSKVVMSGSDVNRLYLWLLKPPLNSLIFGDYTKWCSSLMAYPFPIQYHGVNLHGANYLLSVQSVQRADTETGGCTCRGLLGSYPEFGYTLGEYKVEKFTSFLDYEPYSKYQLWLPYYGYVELKSQYIENKYLEVRLYVDFNTGRAQYVIGVNDNSVSIPIPPYLSGVDDSATRIIGTYNFQIGYEIPLGASGMADMLRNMAVAGVVGTAQLVASAYGSAAGLDKSVTTKTDNTYKVVKRKNSKTGRDRIFSKTSVNRTSTTERDLSNFSTQHRISTAVQTAGDILSAMHITPSLDRVDNSQLNVATCQNVVFIHRKPIIVTDIYSAAYRHLNGSPLCEITPLTNITGYTELSDIHLEGDGFGQITDEEKVRLDSELSNGIIL